MTPAFSCWQDFLAMGGYARYVWLAVICALLGLGGLVVHTLRQRHRLLARVRQRVAREQRIRAAKTRTKSPAAWEENQ